MSRLALLSLAAPMCLATVAAASGRFVRFEPAIAASGLVGQPTLKVSTQSSSGVVADAAALQKLAVVVTIAPLRLITERIVPVGSAIEQLIPTGISEHGYEIPPGKLRLLSKADLVVRIGDALEPQVEKALLASPRASRRVATMIQEADAEHGPRPEGANGASAPHNPNDAHPAKPADAAESKPGHSHGPDDGCDDHGASDPHVWLDPLAIERFAQQIGDQTIARLTAGEPDAARRNIVAATIKQRVALVVADVRAVDAEYKTALASKAHRTIIVTHDAWGHLAKRYNLKTIPLKGLSAGEPTMSALKLATEAVRREKLTTVFLEPQLSSAAVLRIAEATGTGTAVLDPLGSGDWFAMMRANLRAIVASLPESLKAIETQGTSPPQIEPIR